jgi:2-amino-4-hydroxy-6-hydroxymethyldihydropteridine diphosphokinase
VPADQPPFLNAVVTVETWLLPEGLLKALKQIEHDLGRRPERRWGPRPIDLDILFYGDERVEKDTLQVPHPRILQREFVLAPLAEVMAGKLPHLGVTANEALAKMDTTGMRRVGWL